MQPGREGALAGWLRSRWEVRPRGLVKRTQRLRPSTLESSGGQLGAAAVVSGSVLPSCLHVRHFWESLGV